MRPLTVISALFPALLLTGCDPSASEKQKLRADLTQMKEQLDEQKGALEAAEQKARQSVSGQKALKEKIGEMETELEAARKKAAELEKEFTSYKASYRLSMRKKAAGVRLASLSTADGGDFKDVTVLEVNPGEVRFQHAAGIASLSLGGLPEAERKRFAYDAEEAAAWTTARQEEARLAEEAREKVLNFGKGPGEARLLASSGLAPQRKKGSRGAAVSSGGGGGGGEKREQRLAFLRKRQEQVLAAARKVKNDRQGCPVHREIMLTSYQREHALLSSTIQKLSQ